MPRAAGGRSSNPEDGGKMLDGGSDLERIGTGNRETRLDLGGPEDELTRF